MKGGLGQLVDFIAMIMCNVVIIVLIILIFLFVGVIVEVWNLT